MVNGKYKKANLNIEVNAAESIINIVGEKKHLHSFSYNLMCFLVDLVMGQTSEQWSFSIVSVCFIMNWIVAK